MLRVCVLAYLVVGLAASLRAQPMDAPPAEPELEARAFGSAPGFMANVQLVASAPEPPPSAPSLQELGFTPEQSAGSVADQARLDRRTHMLKIHQRLGLITLAPLLATVITSNGASGKSGSSASRNLHGALGIVTAAMYITTASYAIRAPTIPGTQVRGPIRLHKALAWVHGVGMILTPILGAMARNQLDHGERVHGIASAHSAVADVTVAAYAAAIGAVALKF
jgi:hypothetical protein